MPHSSSDQKDAAKGLAGVTVGQTSICSLEKILRYRGYAVSDLVLCSFEEVAHLLLWGDLPTLHQLEAFTERIQSAAGSIPETVVTCFQKLAETSPSSSIMDVLRTGVSILGQLDCDNGPMELPNSGSLAREYMKAEKLLGQVPALLTTWLDCLRGNHPSPWPDKPLATALLEKLGHTEISDIAATAFNTTLILYAEHEFNASTFVARTVTSTGSDLHSGVTAAIGTLKGPLHGGANEKVLHQLMDIGVPENIEPWLTRKLNSNEVVMGFGHRVYKMGDIRADLLDRTCHQLIHSDSIYEPHHELENLAHNVEQLMLERKGLRPNLDWPAARIYHALGLPINLFTPLFVVARVSGWTAHIIEQMDENHLIRPLSKYVGPTPRTYVAIQDRR